MIGMMTMVLAQGLGQIGNHWKLLLDGRTVEIFGQRAEPQCLQPVPFSPGGLRCGLQLVGNLHGHLCILRWTVVLKPL